MQTFNISINDELADIVTQEMKRKKYANRSEFFRDLIRRHYLESNDGIYQIDTVTSNDPDYALLKTRVLDEDITPLTELIQ